MRASIVGALLVGVMLLPAAGSAGECGLSAAVGCEVGGFRAILLEIRKVFADLPGFVDVFYYPGEPTPYRALFLNRLPEQALEREVPYPVEFEVLPGRIVHYGPGPVPDGADLLCPGIRPGALLFIGNAVCTAGFILTDATSTYVSTAGHCIAVGQQASLLGGTLVGTAVFSMSGNVLSDFALIQVAPASLGLVGAEMCDWAGPTGIFTGPSLQGRRVYQTGQALAGFTSAPRPRAGLGDAISGTGFRYFGNSLPGDSGSPARLDGGAALGLVTGGLVLGPVPLPITLGTLLSQGIALAAQGGFPNLQVVTASYVHVLE